MAWTTPRTWVAAETTTAALFNTHISDNLAILKTAIDDNGKFRALSGSYLANLDGSSGLHGVVPLSGVPAWTDVTGGTLAAGVYTKTAPNGWGNGWARSVTFRSNPDDAKLEWTVPGGTVATFVGLSFDFSGDYTLLDYSFYLANLGVADSHIYENSVDRGTITINAGDVLKIDVTAGTVRYYQNGTLLYTSGTAASNTLWACITNYYGTGVIAGVSWSVEGKYTAGNNNYNGADANRVVLPVGTDKFDGFPGAKKPGSFWVEGNYLHWVSSTGVEWRFLGGGISTPAGAVVGSVWSEASGGGSRLSYIDASGNYRVVDSSYSPHTDAATIAGSTWVDTNYVHWSPGGGVVFQAHVDTHTDGTVHTNIAHTNTHTNTHGDVAYSDSHGDTAYSNSHTDFYVNHTDVGHADSHADVHTDVAYSDSHSDSHTDTHTNTHGDVTHSDHSDHGDVAHDDRPENMGT